MTAGGHPPFPGKQCSRVRHRSPPRLSSPVRCGSRGAVRATTRGTPWPGIQPVFCCCCCCRRSATRRSPRLPQELGGRRGVAVLAEIQRRRFPVVQGENVPAVVGEDVPTRHLPVGEARPGGPNLATRNAGGSETESMRLVSEMSAFGARRNMAGFLSERSDS